MKNFIILISFYSLLFIDVLSQEIIDTVYSSDGKIVAVGERLNGKRQGKWMSYYRNGKMESVGFYKNNDKVGKWTWYHDNGLLWSKEKYKYDRFIKGKFWDENGNRATVSDFRILPEYPGGLDAFRQFIGENLSYPKEAEEKGIDGRVYLTFDINEKGELVNLEVIRELYPALDKEAIRVVSLSKNWKPGTFHGYKIKFGFTFPVRFILE